MTPSKWRKLPQPVSPLITVLRVKSRALRRKGWWKLGVPSPGGVLICSPTASSRSGLAALLGEVLAQHEQCLTHIVHIDCQDIETDTLSSALNQLGEQVVISPQ